MAITHDQYELNEESVLQRKIAADLAQSPADKRDNAKDYAEHLVSLDWLAESVGYVLDGNYGYAIHKKARRVARNRRLNRAAWFGQIVASHDHNCPASYARRAWLSLPASDQLAANVCISKTLDAWVDQQETE